MRALAVTGMRRASGLPEVPTLIEAGVPGYEVSAWSGIIAPAGLTASCARAHEFLRDQ